MITKKISFFKFTINRLVLYKLFTIIPCSLKICCLSYSFRSLIQSNFYVLLFFQFKQQFNNLILIIFQLKLINFNREFGSQVFARGRIEGVGTLFTQHAYYNTDNYNRILKQVFGMFEMISHICSKCLIKILEMLAIVKVYIVDEEKRLIS